MNASLPRKPATQAERLAATLRALRRLRKMRPPQVAEAMGLPLRSYEHFESGAGRLNVARVHAFGEATDTDAHAILAALSLDSPAFAVRVADNKLMTVLMMALQALDAELGDDLRLLTARDFHGVFARAAQALAERAQARARALADDPDDR